MTEVEKLSKKHNWNLPTICLHCGSKLEINDTRSRIFCANEECYTYLSSRILRYLNTMGIMYISDATINTLIDYGYVNEVYDIYKIDWEEVSKLDRFGKTSCNKFKKEIYDHRDCTLVQFLSAFNIRNCGWKQIEKMIDGCKNLDDVFKCGWNEFVTNGIGEITAKKFYIGLHSLEKIIRKTAKYVNIVEIDNENVSNKLDGLTFCFTGKIIGYTRNELEQLVIDNGGKIGAVNSKLNYLCSDDENSTSSKMVKAKELGITIITSKEFLKMVE